LARPSISRAESADQILEQFKAANEAREPKDEVERGRMTIVGQGNTKVRDVLIFSKHYGHRTSKSITFFLAPPDLRNVGVLAWIYPDKDDEQWIYFPETERVRRLNVNLSKQSFGESDFSYEDSKLFNDLGRDWTKVGSASLSKDGDLADGVRCTVVDFIPKSEDIPYGLLRMWLNRADWTLRKMELYDRDRSTLVKTLNVSDFVTIDKVPTARHLKLSTVKAGTSTTLDLQETHFNQGLSDELFTQHALEKGPS
jgi:outer membrane lipoprotein-sorting protein